MILIIVAFIHGVSGRNIFIILCIFIHHIFLDFYFFILFSYICSQNMEDFFFWGIKSLIHHLFLYEDWGKSPIFFPKNDAFSSVSHYCFPHLDLWSYANLGCVINNWTSVWVKTAGLCLTDIYVYYCSFFLFLLQYPIWNINNIYSLCLLSIPHSNPSQSFLFLLLQFWRTLLRHFAEYFSLWVYWCFLVIILGLEFWGRIPLGDRFPSHFIISSLTSLWY